MQFRLLSPFRAHFSIDKSHALSNPLLYINHWETVSTFLTKYIKDVDDILSINCSHAGIDIGYMKYVDIYEDANTPSPEALILHANDTPGSIVDSCRLSIQKELDSHGDGKSLFSIVHGSSYFRVFDNTIAMYEVTLDVHQEYFDDEYEALVLWITDWGNAFMDRIVSQFYGSVLYPMFVALWQDGLKNSWTNIIERPGLHKGFPELNPVFEAESYSSGNYRPGNLRTKKLPALSADKYKKNRSYIVAQTLWVNRTAFTFGLTPEFKSNFLKSWIPLSTSEESIYAEIHKEGTVFLGWGHNTIDRPNEDPLCLDAWQALLFVQYYYAAFESLNTGLQRYIGASLSTLSKREIRSLSDTLREIHTFASMTAIEFDENILNLQSSRRSMALALSSRYHIESLIGAVSKKQEVLSDLINKLFEKSTRSYQQFVELILFSLGGLALIDLSISMSSYVKSEVGDPSRSPSQDNVWGVLDLIELIPPDVLLTASMLVLILMSGIYLFLQRNQAT